MVGFAPRAVIDAPARLPLPYGLFSVVSLAEAATERWENGVTWEALTCSPAAVVVGDCDDPEGFPKQFEGGGEIGEASVFTVYGTYKCSPAGNTVASAQDKAEQVLLNREEQAAELRVWHMIDDAPDVLTGGDPLATLARLEKWIGDTYGSLGILHMSREAATVLAVKGFIGPNGRRMETKIGTPVVVGSGYPGTGVAEAAVADTSQFIAATPMMFGYRSQTFKSSNRDGDLLDRGNNDLYGISERNYLIGMDPCGVAFASIDIGVAS